MYLNDIKYTIFSQMKAYGFLIFLILVKHLCLCLLAMVQTTYVQKWAQMKKHKW